MGHDKKSVVHCHSVLKMLLSDLQTPINGGDVGRNELSTHDEQHLPRTSRVRPARNGQKPAKRQRLNNSDYTQIDIGDQPTYQQPSSTVQPLDIASTRDRVEVLYQVDELEWPDFFGQVSWEALFQGDI